MAKLFSKHDMFHFHAIIGFLCLVHFLYRYMRLGVYGCSFGEYEEQYTHTKTFDTLCVAFHLLLHITSFQFHLPAQRSEKRPMIWTEFRIHSALFVLRHVCCTLSHWWLPQSFYHNGGHICFVVMTIWCAKYATTRYGSTEKRTTNAMPYPEHASPDDIQLTKAFYATAQFGATVCALWGPPTVAFLPIFAIEIAPFMMTLVRKGKANALNYHQVYTLALLLHYPVWCICMHQSYKHTITSFWWVLHYACTTVCIYPLRFSQHCIPLPTYVYWCIATFVPCIVSLVLKQMNMLEHVQELKHVSYLCMLFYFVEGLCINSCSLLWQYNQTSCFPKAFLLKQFNIPVSK